MYNKNSKWMKSLAVAAAFTAAGILGQANAASVPFLYTGDNGPGYWGQLNPAWSACAASSTQQSPINIDDAKQDDSLEKLELHTYPTTIHLINTGHNVEQEYEHTGTSVYFEGLDYELLQFHFHTFSEHTIDDKHAAMEMHSVFQEPASGKLLVIGTLYKISDNKSSAFLQTLIDAGLPAKDGDTTVTNTAIDLKDGLTKTDAYYTYAGSLTTPPCSEIVTWVVQKKKAKMSASQFQAFRDIMGNNFRPLQKTNGRVIRVTK